MAHDTLLGSVGSEGARLKHLQIRSWTVFVYYFHIQKPRGNLQVRGVSRAHFSFFSLHSNPPNTYSNLFLNLYEKSFFI